jgi:hypothetical protein
MRRMALRAALVVGAVVAVSVAAFATPALADPINRQCEFFGSTSGGYRAAQCVDYDYDTFSGGFSVATEGLPFCKNASSGAEVVCAGIDSTVTLADITSGDTFTKRYTCGAYNATHTPCHTGTLFTTQYMGGAVPANCNLVESSINTKIELPNGAQETSGTYNGPTDLLPSGCIGSG